MPVQATVPVQTTVPVQATVPIQTTVPMQAKAERGCQATIDISVQDEIFKLLGELLEKCVFLGQQ